MKFRNAILLAAVLSVLQATAQVRAGGANVRDDLFLGVWTPLRSFWRTEVPVCVWSEDPGAGSYRITASSSGSSTNYLMSNDVGATIPYRVFWRDGADRIQRHRLRSGNPSTRSYPYTNDRFCSDGSNAFVQVRVNRRLVDRAMPGIYNDTLILTVVPQ